MAKRKVQKEKQRSTEQYTENKDRATRTPLKIRGALTCSGRVDSSCSTSETGRVILDIFCPSIYGFWLPPFGIFKNFSSISNCLINTVMGQVVIQYIPWNISDKIITNIRINCLPLECFTLFSWQVIFCQRQVIYNWFTLGRLLF